MNSCVLHPPTGRILREDVAGGVIQRDRSFTAPYDPRQQEPATISSTGPWDRRYQSPVNTAASLDDQFSPTDRKRQESNDFPTSKLMLLAVSSSDRTQPLQPEPRFKGGEDERAKMMEWIESKKMHQREIRRLRQIRYRKKKESYTVQLEKETYRIKQQIQKLDQRRRAISTSVPSEKSLWNVAVEYFRLFRFGVRGNTAQNAQLDFLRTTMAVDVMFNAGRGSESIMRNWKYFSLWFHDVQVELNSLKKGSGDSLLATTTTSFTITERSLATVFPHLYRQVKGENARSPLADKLLGRRIVMRGLTRFDWDAGYGRVTSVISESDMLTPMLHILGSLEDVSKVFDQSLISLTPYRGQYRERK